jgi:hypothetical protein
MIVGLAKKVLNTIKLHLWSWVSSDYIDIFLIYKFNPDRDAVAIIQ